MTPSTWEFLAPMTLGVSLFALIGWIVYVIVANRRRQEQMRAVAEFHSRILDRMGSAKDFGEFLATEGGRQFLASLTSEPSTARTRIVRCTENGIVCAAVGIALLVLSRIFPDLGPGLAILGTIVTACGVGFLLSCAASYRLSRSLGLLDEDRAGRRSS
jgi:hypothetical protein